MGIKFLCPNGHKLNVKSFLAGKKAICPKCGARVVVPDDQEATSDSSTDSMARPAGEAAQPPVVAGARASQSASGSVAPVVAAAVPQSDPIAESPDAVWYVRPATGGQYGPASGQIMRDWIKQGRVGASSLVWRAGWDEWRTAQSTFAELATLSGGVAAPPGNGSSASLPLGHVTEPSAAERALTDSMDGSLSTPALSHAAHKRRRKNDVNLIASAILAVVTLILVIVLLLVWRSQNTPVGPEPEESTVSGELTLI